MAVPRIHLELSGFYFYWQRVNEDENVSISLQVFVPIDALVWCERPSGCELEDGFLLYGWGGIIRTKDIVQSVKENPGQSYRFLSTV